MYSRQLEQLARQRQGELRTAKHRTRPASSAARPATTGHEPRKPIRSQTGWALVALGLRIAESGRR